MENNNNKDYDQKGSNSQNQQSQKPGDKSSYENLSTSEHDENRKSAVASGTNPDRYADVSSDPENKDRNSGNGRMVDSDTDSGILNATSQRGNDQGRKDAGTENSDADTAE